MALVVKDVCDNGGYFQAGVNFVISATFTGWRGADPPYGL